MESVNRLAYLISWLINLDIAMNAQLCRFPKMEFVSVDPATKESTMSVHFLVLTLKSQAVIDAVYALFPLDGMKTSKFASALKDFTKMYMEYVYLLN